MLTTLAKLKTRLGIQDADVKDDALLNDFLLAASARFENDCNRTFGYGASVIEEFGGNEFLLRVARYPIDESITATFAIQQSVALGWEPQVVDYLLRGGCVFDLGSPMSSEKCKARVTYAGGYQLPGANQPGSVALPDDLSGACVEQAAYYFQNKDRLGITSMSGQGGSLNQFSGLDLLPSVAAVLKKYERWLN